MLFDPLEAGRRVKAARAYAELTRQELADACGLSLKQMRDLEEGTRVVTTLDELDEIARACEVPEVFLRLGWAMGRDVLEQITELLMMVPGVDLERLAELSRDARNVAAHTPRPRRARPAARPDAVIVRPARSKAT